MTEERIQHFEKLCDVMHGSEATPKNVLQSLGKEAIEMRRLQEENQRLKEAYESSGMMILKKVQGQWVRMLATKLIEV